MIGTRMLLPAALAASVAVSATAGAAVHGTWRYVPHLPTVDLNAVNMAMVWDPVRSRSLIVGGQEEGGVRGVVWALSTSGAAGWTTLPADGAPQTLGYSIEACYDAGRDRLAVWEGGASTLWTVTLGTPAHWTSRAIPGPSPRLNSAGCDYDAARGRMIVFGGYDGQSVKADVWALPLDDVSSWSKLAPSNSGPTGRMNPTVLVDAANDRLIVHGGRDFTGPMIPRGDVWTLSLSGTPQWTPLFTADTVAALRWYGQAAVLDVRRNRVLIFGGAGPGYDTGHAEVSAFALDGSNEWSVAVPPDAERGEIVWPDFAAYDPARDAVFEYGISKGVPGYRTHRLDLAAGPAWSLVAPAMAQAPSRVGQAAVYDPVRRRWLSFGGRYTYYVQHDLYPTTYNDLWSFRPDGSPRWESLPVSGARPPARQDAGLVYDPVSDRVILFGGNLTDGLNPRLRPAGYTHFRGDTWRLDPGDPPSWTALVGGPAPGPRDGHVMVLDAPRHRVLLFGGRDTLGGKADLWALPLDGVPAWTEITPAGASPSPRWQAVGGYDAVQDRLVVACGRGPAGPLTDAWELRLDATTPAWAPLAADGAPPVTGEYARPSVFDPARRRILVFGTGEDPAYPATNPVWELALEGTPAWTPLAPAGWIPDARYGGAAAIDVANDRVAFFAGASDPSASTCRRDHWLLEFAADPTPTPVLVSLLSADATAGRVALAWWAGGLLADARVERRGEDGSWRILGPAALEGNGVARYLDAEVEPGRRYAYRLRWREGGAESATEETWVAVPARPGFALDAPAPNPVAGDVLLTFELPDASRAELALFDLGGRRIESRDVGGLGAGRHALRIGRERALSPGLYIVRLTQGGRETARRLSVIR